MSAPEEVIAESTFSVTLEVTYLEDLNAANYHVVFDPGVLDFLSAAPGEIGGTAVPVDLLNEVSSGIVSIVQSLPGLGSASGSGYLARLQFQVIGAGGSVSSIGFDYKSEQRVLSNTEAEAIPAQFLGTTVRVVEQETVAQY